MDVLQSIVKPMKEACMHTSTDEEKYGNSDTSSLYMTLLQEKENSGVRGKNTACATFEERKIKKNKQKERTVMTTRSGRVLFVDYYC